LLFHNLIIRYFVSSQKRQEYNWCQIDNWAFRPSLPTGRQASSVSLNKENKATGIIVDTQILWFYHEFNGNRKLKE
jgi:hypothetical protein